MKKNLLLIFWLFVIIIAFIFAFSLLRINKQKNSQLNPLIPDTVADPSVAKFGDTFYLYGTTDIDQSLYKSGPPVVWKSKDFVNWSFKGVLIPEIEWNNPIAYINKEGNEQIGYYRYWAPGKPLLKSNRYFIFPTIVSPNGEANTYVAAANSPLGPFKLGNVLIDDIDGEPFVDENGKAYIFWRHRKAAKLASDWLSIKEPIVEIETHRQGYSEGPVMFKRNNIYYYIYTISGHQNYANAYMISHQSPFGPFNKPTGKDIFINSDVKEGIWGPGHGNIFNLPRTDKWIFTYLEYGLGGSTRQVYANWLKFRPNGTIYPIKVNKKGVGYLGPNQKPKLNLALNSTVFSSSQRASETRSVQIETDLNKHKEIGVEFLGQSVKRTSRTNTYEPDNAIDGSNRTQWQAATTDKTPWLMLDFGKSEDIHSSEIFFIFPTLDHAYSLEKSLDNKNWVSVKIEKETEIHSPHITNNIGKTRYLRLNIKNGAPGVWEWKVY